MNISFHHKVALGLLLLATFLVVAWRHDFRAEDPRHAALVSSLQNNLRDRDELTHVLESLGTIRGSIERVAAQGKLDENVGVSVNETLGGLVATGETIFAGQDNPFKQLNADIGEFFKIAGQLALFESKLDEFSSGFNTYFATFNKTAERWKQTTQAAIAESKTVTNTLPFAELDQKVGTLEKVLPEFDSFKTRLQSLNQGFDQWAKEINAASSVAEKQAIFAQKQYLLNGIADLFSSFNSYVQNSAGRERGNVQQIAHQIVGSVTDLQSQVQDKFAVKNNAVQTILAQTKYKDDQYRKVKYAVAGITFAAIILFFFGITIYAFRFEKGLAIFRRKTFEAAQASREVSASLQENAAVAAQTFDLTRTLKEGLADVSQGFLARQGNLQHIDQLVRDTDALIKESHQNFTQIKDEFYNAEKVSQEIVLLTGALEGVAKQMTSVAERVIADPAATTEEAQGRAKTVDELKYLAGRIRYAVNATTQTLDGRTAQIEEAKTKFTLIENNMVQMTENTRQALRGLALARLDHSEEVNRINEILENAKNTSRVIVSEIDALNKQINDFSVLSKHLAALHELAVRASALNAQSLLADQNIAAETETSTSSQRMNVYIQEYFKKVFENPALKADVEPLPTAKTSRLETAADV
jgi:hypothetical protein